MVRVEDIWPEWHGEELLGKGSYGSVWRAVRTSRGHTSYSAVKIINIPGDPAELTNLQQMGMDDEALHTYLEDLANEVMDEIAAMDLLKSAPSTISIEDYELVEHEDGLGYSIGIRMELQEVLTSYYQRTGDPSPAEVARLGIDICRSLEACHDHGIIHRDIKPQNVFVTEYGEHCLGDFGIARRLEQGATTVLSQRGTRSYMAPEVFLGQRYGSSVDIYSLGLMLYRYLNGGRAPFVPPPPARVTPREMLAADERRIRGEALPAPAGADPELAAIVLKACEPVPQHRWLSARRMRNALEAWLLAHPEGEMPPAPVSGVSDEPSVSVGGTSDAPSAPVSGVSDGPVEVVTGTSGTGVPAAGVPDEGSSPWGERFDAYEMTDKRKSHLKAFTERRAQEVPEQEAGAALTSAPSEPQVELPREGTMLIDDTSSTGTGGHRTSMPGWPMAHFPQEPLPEGTGSATMSELFGQAFDATGTGDQRSSRLAAPGALMDGAAPFVGSPDDRQPMHGYRLQGELSTQDAGFSRWGGCIMGDRRFFIKEFLSPVYPVDASGLTPALVERRRKACEEFEARKRALYGALAQCETGNIVVVRDFFRHRSKYYAVTDWVSAAAGLDPQSISRMGHAAKLVFLRTLAYNVATLHAHGIVHADLKPDNILLRKTRRGFVTGKLIDFDAGYLIGQQPEQLQGDVVYLAPETYRAMGGEDVRVNEKADVFALALLAHLYWTGKLPIMAGSHRYAHEAVLAGATIFFDAGLPQDLRSILARMLAADPASRPDARDLFELLANMEMW